MEKNEVTLNFKKCENLFEKAEENYKVGNRSEAYRLTIEALKTIELLLPALILEPFKKLAEQKGKERR